MNLLADLHWLRPGWLLLLPLLPLLLWLRPDARREGAWSAHCDPTLFNYLAVPDGTRNRRWPLALLVIGWLLGVLALAGPSWELAATQVYRSGASRVIVLDLSRSMDATDVTPSRLVRARFKAADLLARAADGRVGLVVFAGDAFALAPVTEDVATLLNLLSPLETALMPVQGSRADRGITRAVELLAGAGAGNGDIVLIADGAPPGAVDAARDALAAGYRVAVLAVGTRAGAPIPDSDGGFVKDTQGNIVVPTVDTGRLLDIAQAGGGRYATLAVDDSDIDRLMRPFEAGLADTQGEEWNRQSQAWLDRGPWLLLALLPLAALGFRRGWLTGLAAVALLVPPSPASALSWADLWQRPEQQVREALADGDTERALQAAPEAPPDWRGSALYRAGEYTDAAQSFADLDDPQADYNRGNALARAGRLEEAIDAYDRALARLPSFDDAMHNRDLVQQLLQQQQQQQQQNEQQDDGQQQADSGEGADQAKPGEQGEQGEQGQPGSGSGDGDPQRADGGASGSDERGAPQDSQRAGEPSSTEAEQREADGGRPEASRSADAADDDRSRASDPQQVGQDAEQGQARTPGELAENAQKDAYDARVEQLLRRVPDDPGGLLRRKFALEYARRVRERVSVENPW